MAREIFREKVLNLVHDLTLIEYKFTVGGTGAVGTLTTTGVESVERLGVGIYRVDLEKDFNRLLGAQHSIVSGLTGSPVAATGLSAGDVCKITAVNNSDFTAIGAKSNTVNTIFVAAASGAGSGTATLFTDCNIVSVNVLDNVVAPVNHIVIQCVTDAGAVADPTSGSAICGLLMLRRGSIKGSGE